MADLTPQSDVLDRLEAVGVAILTELREIKTVLIAGGGLIEYPRDGQAPVLQRRAGTRLIDATADERLPKITLPLSAFVAETNAADADNRRWRNWYTGEVIDLIKAWSRGDYSGPAGRPDGQVDGQDKIPGQV